MKNNVYIHMPTRRKISAYDMGKLLYRHKIEEMRRDGKNFTLDCLPIDELIARGEVWLRSNKEYERIRE